MKDDPLFGAYECRLLVFIENDTYDGFRQVYLTATQFKAVSDAIGREVPATDLKPGFVLMETRLDEERVLAPETFEGMNSINEP